jgi:F-type H+-transporting ATPase subunit a
VDEHTAWSDYLYYLPGWENLSQTLQRWLGRETEFAIFGESYWTLSHVVFALLALLIIAYAGRRFYQSVRAEGGLVPPPRVTVRNLLEVISEALFGLMVQVMGEKHARRHLPFIGSLALFILISNLMALVPGFGVPTATLSTNLVLAGLVFLATHYYGVRAHGGAYFKHFLGPVWYLSWLILPIEIISHLVRPLSLSLRLMGNMAADHKVVFAFFVLVPILIPVPFLFLGLMVAIIQTVVFSLLSMVYISMAVAEDH